MKKLTLLALAACTLAGCTVLCTPAPHNPNMPTTYVVGYPESGTLYRWNSGYRGVHVGYPDGRATRPLDPRDVMSRGVYPDGTRYWSTDAPPRRRGKKK